MSTALAGGAGVFGAVAAGATALFDALAPLVGIIALVGAAFIGWKIYDNYMQKQVQAAQEAGNAWKESNSSIEDYKNRVVELRNQLASGTLTESEAYQAKSELLSIQESLTDSYGSQADGIDLVNGSLREQIGLMDQLSQSDANKYLNENQKGINKATKEMEKNRTYYLGQFYDAEGDEASEALKKAIKNSQEKYGDLITTQQGLDGTLQLYFKGDATQAEAALNDFMTDVRNASDELGGNWMLDNIFSYAESGLKSANKVLDKYQEVYEQAKAAEIAGDKTEYKDKSGDSKTAAEWMRDYSQAVKEYNDALASGDSSKIAEAKTNFDAVDKSVQSLLESDMSGYADSFTEISDQLNTAAISANDFKDAVNGIDTSDGAKEIADAAKELKDLKLDDKDFIYAFETDGVQEGEEQINALVQAALDAGVISDTSSESLQSLANMLIELGVVSGEPVEGMEETTVSMSDMRTAAENLVNGLTTVQSVLSSQQNGKSVSLADFNSDELADYRGALEYVNGTMQLNAEKVREIAKAKAEEQVATNNTNKALEQAQYLENARQIEQYRQQLQDASFAEGETAESIQASIDALLSENSAIADNCAQYDLLSASIQEAVGAYQNWLNAQGASDYGDMANDTVSAIQQIRDTYDANSDIYGNFGSKKFEAAVDFIVPDSVDSEDLSAIESYMANFKEYLRFDDDGVVEGLDIDKFLQKSVDAGLMSYSEDDGFKVLGGKKMEDFAEGLNLSSGVVQAFFDELQLKGANFDWGDEAVKTIGDLAVEANEAAESLRQMDGNSDLKIKMDVSDLSTTEEQINALDATIAEMDGVKARPDVDASSIDNANAVIQYCLTQKQLLSQPDVMRVDTSQVEGEIGNAISLLQQFQNATNDLEIKQKVGADTSEAESKVNSLASEIEGISPDIKAKLNIDSTSVDSIKTSIAGLSAETINVKANVDASAIDGYNPESKKCDVIYDPKTDLLPESFSSINRTVNYIANTANLPSSFSTITRYVNYVKTGSNVSGTAHAGGTARADLADAMDNLEETQYEHYISEQKKLLDNLYDEYEAILNERLDNIDALMADMINTINQNSANISTTLQTQSDKVGYDLTAAMKSIWTNEGGAGSIITKYGESFLTQMTSVNDVITKIAYKIGAMVKESDKKADSTISSATPSTKTDTSAKPPTQANTPAKQPTNNTPKFNEDVKRGVAAAIWIYGSKSGWGNNPDRKKRLTAKFGASNAAAVQSYINAHANNGDLYRYWVSTGKSNLSKYYYSAFKKGGLADYTGMAWLDGTPTEPEMVLNPKDTQNFIALKDAMRSIADGNNPLSELFGGDDGAANVLSQLAKIGAPISGRETNIGDITYQVTIPIEHVQDYNDFMNQMRKDGKFEKMIRSMTVDQLSGGSKLSKNKYQW